MFEMRLGGAFTQPCAKWKTSDERRNAFRLWTNNNPVRSIRDRSCCAAIWMNLLWRSQKKFETSNSAWMISAAGLTRETKEASPEKSRLFRWADKEQDQKKKKMNKINHGCKVIGHMCKVDRRWREKLVCLFKRLHNRAQVCDVNYALSRGMEIFNFNPQLCEKIFQFLPWPTFSVLSNEAAHRQACHCLLSMACN